MEPFTSHAISWEPLYKQFGRDWKMVNDFITIQRTLWMLPVNVLINAIMYIIVSLFFFSLFNSSPHL
jgi:hypothetical protein